jgi:hypothetical protein
MGADLQGRIGHDVGDVCDLIWANALGTGLGGPDGDPSPAVSALRAPSLSQDNREAGGANNAPASNK